MKTTDCLVCGHAVPCQDHAPRGFAERVVPPESEATIREWCRNGELGARMGKLGMAQAIVDLLATLDAVRKTLETAATWWGGPDHHRDDCPVEGGCEECLMADAINAAVDAGRLATARTELVAEQNAEADRIMRGG